SNIIDWGKRLMIPIMINIEIPFPIPLSVIRSPNHIQNIVPEVRIITADIVKNVLSINIASEGIVVVSYEDPWANGIKMVRTLVIGLILFLPDSPSFCSY